MEHAVRVLNDERYDVWGDSQTWKSAKIFSQYIFSEYDPCVIDEQETHNADPIDCEDSDGIKIFR